MPDRFTPPSTSIDQPCSGKFKFSVTQLVVNKLGFTRNNICTLISSDCRVFKETTGVTNHLRLGQLGPADRANPIKDLHRRGLIKSSLNHSFVQISVPQFCAPLLWQSKPNASDDRAPGETHARGGCDPLSRAVLENGISVAKTAVNGLQAHPLSRFQMNGVQRFEPVL